MNNLVRQLKARWIAKRNEFIQGKVKDGRIYDGPDGYASRELRAYRLALVWARDTSLPGQWYWVRRDQRWDVYPCYEPNTLMRVTADGQFYPDGTPSRISYILVRRCIT